MLPFHLRYTLGRRQRLAVEFYPWLPCLAATLGFVFGVVYLSAAVSPWFLPLLLVPPVAYRGFFRFLLDLAVHPTKPMDELVDATGFGVLVDGVRRWLPLTGIIQVYRSDDHTAWTVLHLNGSIVTVPATAITAEQLDYLKGFALRAAIARRNSSRDAELL